MEKGHTVGVCPLCLHNMNLYGFSTFLHFHGYTCDCVWCLCTIMQHLYKSASFVKKSIPICSEWYIGVQPEGSCAVIFLSFNRTYILYVSSGSYKNVMWLWLVEGAEIDAVNNSLCGISEQLMAFWRTQVVRQGCFQSFPCVHFSYVAPVGNSEVWEFLSWRRNVVFTNGLIHCQQWTQGKVWMCDCVLFYTVCFIFSLPV